VRATRKREAAGKGRGTGPMQWRRGCNRRYPRHFWAISKATWANGRRVCGPISRHRRHDGHFRHFYPSVRVYPRL